MFQSKVSKAFTIIELVMVVVILGIMVSIAGPNYTRSINRSYARDAINNLNIIQAANTIYRVRNGLNFACAAGDSLGSPSACRTLINGMNGADSLNIISTGGSMYHCNGGLCYAEGKGGTFAAIHDNDGLFEAEVSLASGSSTATCNTAYGVCP